MGEDAGDGTRPFPPFPPFPPFAPFASFFAGEDDCLAGEDDCLVGGDDCPRPSPSTFFGLLSAQNVAYIRVQRVQGVYIRVQRVQGVYISIQRVQGVYISTEGAGRIHQYRGCRGAYTRENACAIYM
jgi:hypothetical protein